MTTLSEFSIGAALDAYDSARYAEREAERDAQPRADGLDAYASHLTSTAHPAQECCDPSTCPSHSDEWWSYMQGDTDAHLSGN